MAASYISVPRDLTRVKSKVMFNMTKRQLICFSMAALIGVPSFFMLKKLGSPTVAAMGMVVIMMPFFFFAMYERNGQTLEVILGHFIQANFIRPKKRPYMTDNYYSALIRQAYAEKEVRKIVRVSKEKEGKSVSNAGKSVKKGAKRSKRDN